MRRIRAQHAPHDFSHLLRRLPAREYDFGISLAQRAVMIDLRKTDILERKLAQALDRLIRANLARAQRLDKASDIRFVHSVFPPHDFSTASRSPSRLQ